MAAARSQFDNRVSELTHVAPIRQGLIPGQETLRYVDRLRIVLDAFRVGQGRGAPDPLDKVRAVHFARWAIIDNDTKLLFASSYDGEWSRYLDAFRRKVPGLLDLIWQHCEDYPLAVSPTFDAWVERFQQTVSLFCAAQPDLTVRDIERLARIREVLSEIELRVQRAPDDAPKLLAELCAAVNEPEANRAPHRSARPGSRDEFMQLSRLFVESDSARAIFANAVVELFGEPAAATRVDGSAAAPRLDLKDIQGNILRPYDHERAHLVFFAVQDRRLAAAWLAHLAEELTDASAKPEGPGATVNVALTARGLHALGLSPEEMASFPDDFLEGMRARAAQLGDTGVNAPEQWERRGDVHGVLILQGGKHPLNEVADVARRLAREAETRCSAHAGIVILFQEALGRLRDAGGAPIEHFGFRDGISQPVFEGTLTGGAPARDVLPPDTVLLDPSGPESLRRNGSFLVMRKLEQDVPAFDAFLGDTAPALRLTRDELAAKLVGRAKDGTPLVPLATGADQNDFDYAGPGAAACPMHAHVRRANPRLATGPAADFVRSRRIVRRGMTYGPPHAASESEGTRRGVMFMAYNASISQQFEFIQSRWMNSGNDAEGFSSDQDPIGGTDDATASRIRSRFAFPMDDGTIATFSRMRRAGDPAPPFEMKRFVQLRWGEYFFMPSRSGLRTMGRLLDREASASGGAPPACPPTEEECLAHGARRVSTPAEVQEVLATRRCPASAGGPLSVREYDRRMRSTTGSFFLGLDEDSPAYAPDRRRADALLGRLMRQRAELTRSAQEQTLLVLDRASATPHFDPRMLVAVPLHIAGRYFGFAGPSDRVMATWLEMASEYIFQPFPPPEVVAGAPAAGRALRAYVAELIARRRVAGSVPDSLLDWLLADEPDDERASSMLIGLTSGFVVPTTGTFVSGMTAILASAARVDEVRGVAEDPSRLARAVVRAARTKPVPAALYRSDSSGARVVADLAAAMESDDRVELQFGAGAHACPGKDLAEAVMGGMAKAVLRFHLGVSSDPFGWCFAR